MSINPNDIGPSIYINGTGNVSPQPTTGNTLFLEETRSDVTNRLKTIDPVYKDFIPADQLRRMSRIIRMGIASAKLCLADAGVAIPGAIITGTGLGCLEDTEKFLATMIRNKEEFLTPTSFIQSTHNTVSGQIALLLKCHEYNFTYVHRGFSFESALIDSICQIRSGNLDNILTGGMDEVTDTYFAIMERLGSWRRKAADTLSLLDTQARGTIAGEGSAFFLLQKEKTSKTYARLDGVLNLFRPAGKEEVALRLEHFLSRQGFHLEDISLVITGANGDSANDRVYREFASHCIPYIPSAGYKNLCGEYMTSTAFATWLAAMILGRQTIPAAVKTSLPVKDINTILIHNHFQNLDHSFILLSKAR